MLLIGAGEVSELAAKQLTKRAKQLLVLGRDYSRAKRFAEYYGGRAITSDQLDDALSASDVVICATGTPLPIVTRDQLRRALARRSAHSRLLLLIDLSVPRDVGPTARDLPGLEVHTIDELRGTVERTLVQRRAELPAARAVLRDEVARFTDWLGRRELAA